MESLIAVAGTLLGAVVGVLGSFLVQRAAHRSEFEERLSTARRQVYLDFLACSHALFVQVAALHLSHRNGELTDDEVRDALHRLSPVEAQTALESLRMVASNNVAEAAAGLWSHLRSHDVPLGRRLGGREFIPWREHYWKVRHRIIDAAREDTGFAPLDWTTAGAGQHRHQEGRLPIVPDA